MIHSSPCGWSWCSLICCQENMGGTKIQFWSTWIIRENHENCLTKFSSWVEFRIRFLETTFLEDLVELCWFGCGLAKIKAPTLNFGTDLFQWLVSGQLPSEYLKKNSICNLCTVLNYLVVVMAVVVICWIYHIRVHMSIWPWLSLFSTEFVTCCMVLEFVLIDTSSCYAATRNAD